MARLDTLLIQAAEQRPDHVAVEDARGALTYGALNESAGRIAAVLRDLGVLPGDRVGLLHPKSADAVAALYGIMGAGGAYVPLDLGSPAARLGAIIRDCGIRVLIGDSTSAARLFASERSLPIEHLVRLDDAASATGVHSTTNVVTRNEVDAASPVSACDSADDALAYILYTSGSTGAPKGVMISHGNAWAFVDWARQTIGIGPDDRLSSHAPFHFDLSVFDLYVASAARATVCIVPDGTAMFPASLSEWIEARGISVWYSVPSALVQMGERGRVDRFAFERLRRVCFAGEVMPSRHLRAWMERLSRARWFNLYGPTETNVCTYYEPTCPPADDAPIPIGHAASGDVIYLLGEDGRVIRDPGVEGEVWVDGPTVARGYFGDERKTAEQFVVRRELAGHDRPLYRTGDLAAWRADGELLFHGRRDSMIKCRGYRIELGEIEAAAHGCPAVEEACAVAIPDEQIGHRIRLVVVPRGGTTLDRAEVERRLLERLPRYMMPGELVVAMDLPRTSSGKIDRQRLAQEAAS